MHPPLRPRAHRVLPAARWRGEDLARDLGTSRLHRLPTDGCRERAAHLTPHPYNW